MNNLTHCLVFAQTDANQEKLPPMTDEPNQAAIDAEAARRLREAARERREQGKTRFVTVVADGPVYRWQRFDGITRRTSSEAWVAITDAIAAAIVVAQCYGVSLQGAPA